MAAKLDLTIEQGATFTRVLTWKDKTGTPIDLTGCTAKMQGRLMPNDSVVLLDLSSENGGIVITGSEGVITIRMESTATAGLRFEQGFYDLLITLSNGDDGRLLQGRLFVSPGVTR